MVFSALSAAAYGDAFVTSQIGEPSNLIPFLATDSSSAEVSRLIFNGLVKYDDELKLTGDLVESWEVLDGGLEIIFHLRKNVLWQDGVPFTSKDVEFTFRAIMDPSTPTPYSSNFEKVASVEAVDPYTVRVAYREPFSPGLASWGMGIVPEHLLAGQDLRTTPFARHPVGTGPYLLKKWQTGQKIELTANPRYFEGRPGIERVVYRVLPDGATRFLELETENLDMASLAPLEFARQTDSPFFRSRYKKYRFPGFSYLYIGYNLENPLFADKRVRRAMGLAIPKQKIIDAVLLGFGKVSTGPFLPNSWAFDSAVKESPFDPGRARRLLAEARWRDTDGDGILDKDGRRFSFTLLTNQGNDQRKMTAEIVQRYLKDVGIEMKIQVVEWGTFLREFIDKKRFEAVLLAWQLGRDPDVYEIFHSASAKPGGFNFVSFKDERVDRLLEEGRRVFGEERRAPIYRQIHRILSEEEPYTFLYVPEALPILHRRFRGPKETPIGLADNFVRWFVPQKEEKYPIRAAVDG